MPFNGEKSSKTSQSSILKEENYIDFFQNCAKSDTTIKGVENIKKNFVPYIHAFSNFDGRDVENVMGIDGSYVEQSLYEQTGQISPFSSHKILIIKIAESITNLKKLEDLENRRMRGEYVDPMLLRECTQLHDFNFWFNGSNLTPHNTKKEWLNPKNGFKVSTRDALRKPEAILTNQNSNYKNNNTQVKNESDMRLIDAYYYLFSVLKNEGLLQKGVFDFDFSPSLNSPSSNFNNGRLIARLCPNKYSCAYSNTEYDADTVLSLSPEDKLEDDIVCPTCKQIICELDAIRLANQFQEEMSNISLLNEMTLFIEHLRIIQRLVCLSRNNCSKWALVADGPLALFKQSQSVIPGFRKIVGNAIDCGATVFGVVKSGVSYEFFEAIDNGDTKIEPGSFYIVRNKDRYKYIQPRYSNEKYTHGFETHYGIDILVKTSKGLRFVISMALPSGISKGLYSSSANEADDIFTSLNEDPQSYPELVKMLKTLERIQMMLFGGSTIPQTKTHSQASISRSVSGPVLARAIRK